MMTDELKKYMADLVTAREWARVVRAELKRRRFGLWLCAAAEQPK